MKIAIVNSEKVWPMFTHGDLIEFLEWQKRCIEDDVQTLIKSAVPYDRWDHVEPTCVKTIYKMALVKIQMGKSAPLFAHSHSFTQYAETLFDAFDVVPKEFPDSVIYVNMNGGWNSSDKANFSEIKKFIPSAGKSLVLRGDNPILIIENDAELDEWTRENLNQNFSYITSLRRYDSVQLERAFSDFHIHCNYLKGQTALFVYTTAMDGKQMLDYVQSAKNRYFRKIIWVLSTDEYMGNAVQAKTFAESLGISADIYTAEDFLDNSDLRKSLNL